MANDLTMDRPLPIRASRDGLRTVAIVAPHFVPSNLAGVHRARLLAQHLGEFGWRPLIVTTHWRHYEEAVDPGLAELVDPDVEVIRTGALPARPLRMVGDIGIRALPWHLAALRRLRREAAPDFVLITVPSFFSAALGPLLWRDEPLAYGIDYIDPWVHLWPEAEIRFSKAWASFKLGSMLEPHCVRHASLISGVAPGYYAGVLDRNPHLKDNCVTAAMPYGFSTRDFAAPAIARVKLSEFDPADGNLHLVYAGALLPKAHAVLERLFEGVASFRNSGRSAASRLRLHFIGTGKSPSDPQSYNIRLIAERHGLGGIVTEHPHRMAYLDVLAHLTKSTGILILGSTERHYTPSKVYQSVQAQRPILAFLHEDSQAVDVLARSRAGVALRITDTTLPDASLVVETLDKFLMNSFYDSALVDWHRFDAFSARESARVAANAMDEAVARFKRSKVRAA